MTSGTAATRGASAATLSAGRKNIIHLRSRLHIPREKGKSRAAASESPANARGRRRPALVGKGALSLFLYREYITAAARG